MPARNFVELIQLIRTAEECLKKAGQVDPLLRVTTMRGIFYGSQWSRDYRTEKSEARNWGFWTFTGGQEPPDPRPALGEKLFKEIQASQDIKDRGRSIDFGHVLIGMDARKRYVSRAVNIPYMGGSGLEISTWLGDLGGGAANIAFKRLRNPQIGVDHFGFSPNGSDYGASINLEGDIGGYLVASGSSKCPAEPEFPQGKGIADALERYLLISTSGQEWKTRAARFTIALGGTIENGRLIYAADLSSKLTQKIEDWGAWYLSQRYILSGQLKGKQITEACRNLMGAASEVATTFVRALTFRYH